MTVYRVHSYMYMRWAFEEQFPISQNHMAFPCVSACMCVCASWPGRWRRIVTIAIILFFYFPPTIKKGFWQTGTPWKKNTLLGHGPRNNSHNTPTLCKRWRDSSANGLPIYTNIIQYIDMYIRSALHILRGGSRIYII